MIRIFFCLLFLLFSFGSAYARQTVETGFLNRTVVIGEKSYRYQVYLPFEYTRAKKWPVILFLHGSGERGEDGLLQTEVGLAHAIRRQAERFPAIIVFPQCPPSGHWTFLETEAHALKTLDLTLEEFSCDRQRVYLTGISMGGAGTVYIAARNPSRFAAVVAVCPWIVPPQNLSSLPIIPPEVAEITTKEDPYTSLAEMIGKTPIWLFHGKDDNVVSVSESRRLVEALKVFSKRVKYTEFEETGHNCWDKAYEEEGLTNWLFSQKMSMRLRQHSKRVTAEARNRAR
ncbi:MAG: prolyl oligopeptidase family serine peptidase [Blastocatellia bacterium]|nr:prolyl oligopeptidase family serine peptidase [Blastocatellia bacterium]